MNKNSSSQVGVDPGIDESTLITLEERFDYMGYSTFHFNSIIS